MNPFLNLTIINLPFPRFLLPLSPFRSFCASPPDIVGEGYYVFLDIPFVRLYSEILLPRYLMNGLDSFDKTDREYSLALW